MARDDVATVRAGFDAWSRGDTDAMLALAHPDIEVRQPPQQPDFRVYHGRDGLLEVMTSWQGSWEGFELDAPELRQAGDCVVATVMQRLRGGGSGIPLEVTVFFVFRVSEGLITRFDMFLDEAEALEAATRAA